MPQTTRQGQAKQSELPSTLRKSNTKAQTTFAKAHDSAVESYGAGRRAHRVACSALTQVTTRSATTVKARTTRGHRMGGPAVTTQMRKVPLRNELARTPARSTCCRWRAHRLDIRGRSTMNKKQLVTAIEKEDRRETRKR